MRARFSENMDEFSILSLALAGFEIFEPEFNRISHFDSTETGFLDGTARSFLDPGEPCSFGTLCYLVEKNT